MKSRAEVIAEKKAAAAKKASAEERTIPLPMVPPGAVVTCEACDAESPAEKCSIRPDGFAECPECGSPVTMGPDKEPKPAPKEEASTRVDAKPTGAWKHPERKWCGECGCELSFTATQIFFPCNHDKAERIDDPRKARKIAPPGGLQTRTDHEIAKRDAAEKRLPETPKLPNIPMTKSSKSPEPTAVATGNRLSIQWGETRHPVGDGYNYFKVGGFIATVDLPEGADRVAVAREILNELEEIAEIAFQREKAWYHKKLGM